ncbi:MAG: hypothetical protein Q9223_004303 [Gallowayella weberi]
MSRRRTDTLESYEGFPLDSPERPKKINSASIASPRPGQAPVQQATVASDSSKESCKPVMTTQPVECPKFGSTLASPNARLLSTPPRPDIQDRNIKEPGVNNFLPPPNHFDQDDNNLIGQLLTDGLGCSILDAVSTDMPRGVASTSLNGGALVNESIQKRSALHETESSRPSQEPSRFATADFDFSWDDGDFSSEFGLSYRPAKMAPLSVNMLTSTTVPILESAEEAAAAPQDLVLPSNKPKWTSPYLTSPLQNGSMSHAGASHENEPRNNCVWRHPAHTATLLRLQVAEAKNEVLESRIEVERERAARFQEQARHAQQMQQIEKRAGSRCERSNDHYINASRKRLIRPRTPKEQSVTSHDSLLSWIRDCEEYIRAADYDFGTDIDMVTWSASLLVQKRKDQWRTYADTLHSQGIEITWKIPNTRWSGRSIQAMTIGIDRASIRGAIAVHACENAVHLCEELREIQKEK